MRSLRHMTHNAPKQYVFKKHFLIILTIVILTWITIFYIIQRDVLATPYNLHLEAHKNDASCHFLTEEDALPSAEDDGFSPRPNSIFFHESSCRGGLTSRQACAVESAARAHPRRQVYVLFSAPVNEVVLGRNNLARLRLFPNVRLGRVHITDYAKNTPLEEMVANKPFSESEWWIQHSSDLLRCLTLYKWGGVYLDTDMIVTKSLSPLGHNWVVKGSNGLVNTAAIAISMDHLGRKLATALINEVKTTYRSDLWLHNGPGAITRVLHKTCNTHNVVEWSSNTCQGLEVYGPEYFNPLQYAKKSDYFKTGDLEAQAENAYVYHFWNTLTQNMTVEKDSPYEKMAMQYCPTVYKMYGDDFGI